MTIFQPHDGSHTGCPECFKFKIRNISFQGSGAASRRAQDKTRDADMWAYKRLRRQGVQPQHVFGAAEVEMRAGSQFEVEHNMVMSAEVRKEFTSRLEESRAS